jgi:hypothetical protein
MKTISESIRPATPSPYRRAPQASPHAAKSDPVSLTPAPRADQRRVFWLFIFSFSLVLVYGGCSQGSGPRSVKHNAEKTAVRHAVLAPHPNAS